jgi:tRNA-splicing ligase RtcB
MKYETIINGEYNSAKVFTDKIEQSAKDQIKTLCDQEFVKDTQIRIMSDVHAGSGCVIGFTMAIKDKVVPNLLGVDISCGVLVFNLGKIDIDLPTMNYRIRNEIPSGRNIHEGAVVRMPELSTLKCYRELKDTSKFERSLGSLGGGNHFIEIDVNPSDGITYIVIHSGSRNLGHQVATYYQKLAIDLCKGKDKYFEEKDNLIKSYKAAGRKTEIHKALKDLEAEYNNLTTNIPEDLCYLSGKYLDNYLHDVKICQDYARLNRYTMGKYIIEKILGLDIINDVPDMFETVHNYIDFSGEVPILRKGAVSAKEGEILIIPMNMRDGSLICKGKGNPDWNYSAPHGAGRLMSRTAARNTLDMVSYAESMSSIYTTSVCEGTLDEAPGAYKPMAEIVERIGDTVEIISHIKPIYNFKATDEE